MLEHLWFQIEHVLGFDAEALAWWQLAIRVLFIYGFGLLLVRLGKRRFMGSYSAFDMILGITVGALLASAANASPVFLNALGIVLGLVLLHATLAYFTYRWEWLDNLVKGSHYDLIRDGEVQREGMRKGTLSRSDLAQALRAQGIDDLGYVRRAQMERNGQISILQTTGEGDDETEQDDMTLEEAIDRGRGPSPSRPDAAPHAAARRHADDYWPKIVSVDVREGVQRVVVELNRPTPGEQHLPSA